MSAFSLQITEAVARLLTPAEREAVLGDLAEARCGLWRSLAEVLGFAARRQIFLWRSWRPWAASCGLALPVSLFLGGFSLGTVSTVLKWAAFPSDDSLFWSCLFHTVLLLCWAWLAGFAGAWIAPRTLWASLLAICLPCLYCLSRWPGHSASGLQLLIFLPPTLCGVWRARCGRPLRLHWAILLTSTTLVTPLLWDKSGWIFGCGLLWPGWYMTITAFRSRAHN